MEFQRKPTPCNYKLPNLKEFVGDNMDIAKTIIPIQKDDFLELCVSDDGVVHSDIWLIKNKDRLDMYNAQDFAQLVATRFAQKQVNNPYDGLSDEQLFETIKPRSFQSPSELKAWFEYIDSCSTELAEAIKASQSELVNNTEETKSE